MIQVYSIRDLERVTGVPRTTIHYYLRQGLLPRPQKTAASRSLYTDEHVKILKKIAELKQRGPLSPGDRERAPAPRRPSERSHRGPGGAGARADAQPHPRSCRPGVRDQGIQEHACHDHHAQARDHGDLVLQPLPQQAPLARRVRDRPDELEHQVRRRQAGGDRGLGRTPLVEPLRSLARVRTRLCRPCGHPGRRYPGRR